MYGHGSTHRAMDPSPQEEGDQRMEGRKGRKRQAAPGGSEHSAFHVHGKSRDETYIPGQHRRRGGKEPQCESPPAFLRLGVVMRRAKPVIAAADSTTCNANDEECASNSPAPPSRPPWQARGSRPPHPLDRPEYGIFHYDRYGAIQHEQEWEPIEPQRDY